MMEQESSNVRKESNSSLETYSLPNAVDIELQEGFDLRFQNPASFLLIGSSMSGKTSFVLRCLDNIEKLFADPRCGQNVIFFYKTWQDKYEIFARKNVVKEWLPIFPSREIFEEKTRLYSRIGGSIVVVDDWDNLKHDTIDIFSISTHHNNVATFFLLHSLFPDNAAYRQISKQASYNVIFKSTRDKQQLVTFAHQMYARKWQAVAYLS